MAEREVKGWFTLNGKHIPIFEGESKQDAVNRSIAKDNEDLKNKQIGVWQQKINEMNKNSKLYEKDPETGMLKSSKDKIDKMSVEELKKEMDANQKYIDKVTDEKSKAKHQRIQEYMKNKLAETEKKSKNQAINRTNNILKEYSTKNGYKMDDVDSRELQNALYKFYSENSGSAVGHTITHNNGILYIDGKAVTRFAVKNDLIKSRNLGRGYSEQSYGIEGKILKHSETDYD